MPPLMKRGILPYLKRDQATSGEDEVLCPSRVSSAITAHSPELVPTVLFHEKSPCETDRSTTFNSAPIPDIRKDVIDLITKLAAGQRVGIRVE